ncbi:hypothetical protein E4U21_004027 [Claviceps maximensis]|nr:hypothetical protein E4U21_004027 [Claviceps maximensis]
MPGIPVAYREIPDARSSLLAMNKILTLQSTSTKIRDGLALFAVLVIVRFSLKRMQRAWISIKTRTASKTNQLRAPNGLLTHRQRPPPFYTRPVFTNAQSVHSGRTFFNTMEERREPTSSGGSSHDSIRSPGEKTMLHSDLHWQSDAEEIRGLASSRMPLAAQSLTAPHTLSSFAAAPRAPGQPDAIDRFIHQPNPDYMSFTTSAMSQPDSFATPTTPRRRSYHRRVLVGNVTTITPPSFSVDVHSTTAQASVSSSSYPPKSPLLPLLTPLPPDAIDPVCSNIKTHARLMDVEGEIVFSLDRDGNEWTRHTRVYGGGVCLACTDSGDRSGGRGFYEATVMPEEMQQDA